MVASSILFFVVGSNKLLLKKIYYFILFFKKLMMTTYIHIMLMCDGLMCAGVPGVPVCSCAYIGLLNTGL